VKALALPHRLRTWFAGLNPWVVDGVVAAGLVVLGLVSTDGRGGIPKADYEPMDTLGVLLVLGGTVPFVFRRRAPLAVLVVASACVALLSGLGHNEGITPVFLYGAAVTVGAACDLRTTFIGAGFVFVALLALLLFGHSGFDAANFAANVAIFGSAFMFGVTIRSRRMRIVALEERTTAIEREREEEARRSLSEERLRIARELHDVVAHSMGVIAVQAGVGEHVIETDPASAKRSLQAISDVSRSTLAEIRHMLGVLREDGDAAATYTPAPGLADLDRLTKELEGAGVPVVVSFTGSHREIPRGVDLSAYRIIQEALTNVLKHAGNARVSVTVNYEPGGLRLEIVDDGRGVNGRSSGGGHGLVGMRERVAVYGGSLQSGPRVGGGYQVIAMLPYEDAS
jgi:signal transduction histidine kinase